VGANLQDAPPGHRYLLYLPFWKEDWNAIKEGKQEALKKLGAIPNHVGDMMRALVERQRAIGAAIGAEVIEAVSISPFATGLGWEHPNENGFAFLHPYGLPYLAASGVKGVLRDAARELSDGLDGETHGWTKDAITRLFGPLPEEIKKPEDALRGALRFFDVIPEIAGKSMGVDIMNPHYSDYYQGNSTPHDAGSPVPIFFLVVPPTSRFTFVVDCPREHLLPEGLRSKWRLMIRAAFEHAFAWLGFGAKTAVGYGAMESDAMRKTREAQESLRREAERRAEEARRQEQALANAETWEGARIKFNRDNGSLSVEKGGKSAYAYAPKGEALLATLPAEVRKKIEKIETNQFVKVTARVAGSELLEVSP